MRLPASSSASGVHCGADSLSGASQLSRWETCFVTYSLLGGAFEGLSLLGGETSAAPGVLICVRCWWCLWRTLRRRLPSTWETCFVTYSLRGGKSERPSLFRRGPSPGPRRLRQRQVSRQYWRHLRHQRPSKWETYLLTYSLCNSMFKDLDLPWGRAVCGSRHPNQRQVLLAVLAAPP